MLHVDDQLPRRMNLSFSLYGIDTNMFYPYFADLLGFEFELPPRDVLKRWFDEESKPRTLVWEGLKPQQEDDWPELKKWTQYLANAKAFFSDWNFSSSSSPHLVGENPVSHYNLYGTVYGGASPSNRYRPLENPYSSTLPVRHQFIVTGTPGGYHTSMGAEGTFAPSKSWSVGGRQMIEDLRSGIYDTVNYPVGNTILNNRVTRVEDLVVDGYLMGFIVDWELTQYRPSDGWTYGYTTAWLLKLNIEDYRDPVIGVLEDLNDCFQASLECRTFLYYSNQVYYGNPHQTYTVKTFNDDWSAVGGSLKPTPLYAVVLYFTGPWLEDGDITPLIGYARIPGHDGWEQGGIEDKYFFSFIRIANSMRRDLMAGAFLSSQDAIDKDLERITSGCLEYFQEVSGVFGLVEVARIPALIRAASNRKKFLPLFLAVLDLAADARLLYSFGIAPTLRDAEAVSEGAKDLISRYSVETLHDVHETRGKYTLELPWTEIMGTFDGLIAEHRSKIRYRIPPDSFLTAILPVRSMGLLPTFSELWNLVPFSFVLDWFTGLGTNMDRVETAAMMLALEVEMSVHSVSLRYPFKAADLQPLYLYQKDDANAKGAGYVYYNRAVLSTLPTLTPTRLPYYAPPAMHWETPTALVWKLIRH